MSRDDASGNAAAGPIDATRLRRILAARESMLRVLGDIAGDVADSALVRCPYRTRDDVCTFRGECINAITAPGRRRLCGGGALNPMPPPAAAVAAAMQATALPVDTNRTGNAMNSRERMAAAMRLEEPDRVPVMCQLALGHYFLNTGLDAIEIWHDTAAFGDALIMLQQRYGFDGILINLPGRDPAWRSAIDRIEEVDGDRHVVWRNGWVTIAPPDDNPHVYQSDRATRWFPTFDEVEPEHLYYMEPHDISAITYPYSWGFDAGPAPRDAFFPPWHYDTIRYVRERAPDVSVHGEVFSPFSQFMEMLDYVNGLMALIDDPVKVGACLDALTEGTIDLMRGQATAGADAILISSAFAGAGLISRDHYREFVLPYEKRAVDGFHEAFPGVPVYTHTCGSIGDRLELLEATGTNGVDTLDPPPLGDVDLADAKHRIGGRLFIKGNMDPVNTVLMGTAADTLEDAKRRIAIGAPGGGYILSTACSVSPAAPPANIMQLRMAADAADVYRR